MEGSTPSPLSIIDVLFCNPFFFFLSHRQIVRPINAFLVVDVQNDFISGSLNISNCAAQQNGIEVRNKGTSFCFLLFKLRAQKRLSNDE
jgi:hypothetical protein